MPTPPGISSSPRRINVSGLPWRVEESKLTALNLLLDSLGLGASDSGLGALRLERRAPITTAASVECLLE